MATPKTPRATSSTSKSKKTAVTATTPEATAQKAVAQENVAPKAVPQKAVIQSTSTNGTHKSNGNGRVNVEDSIRVRAYQLFEQRGRRHGFDKEDWLRAEVEVSSSKGAYSA